MVVSLPACLVWLAAFIAAAYGQCIPPPLLSNTTNNADPTKDSYEIGSTVTYVCDETNGYVQSPGKPNTITCQDDSTWSEIQEFCERSCKLPPRFQYGELQEDFINKNVFPVGTNVTYKCRPGYVIIRRLPKTVTCLDTLEWTKIEEFCERKDCRNPGEILNGHVEFQTGEDGQIDTKFGSSVTFVCNLGFRLVGRKMRTCTAEGWNNALPECETVICPKPPDLANGTYTSMGQEEFKYQNGVTYSCNLKAFSLIGEATIYCTEHSDWSGPAPKCKVIRCTNPHVPNANRISGFGVSHTFKDSVEFVCKSGFVIKGSNRIECGEDNEWHPEVPVCQPVNESFTCDIPSIPHGEVITVSEDHKFIEIRCDMFYVLHGEKWMRCIGQNRWDVPLPKCYLLQGVVAGIIILVLIVLVGVAVGCYCYNKKKQGHYPTNEKGATKAEGIQLKKSDNAADA